MLQVEKGDSYANQQYQFNALDKNDNLVDILWQNARNWK